LFLQLSETVLLPLKVDATSMKAYINESVHNFWAAVDQDEDAPEELAEQASSKLAEYIISNGASKAAWQQFTNILGTQGLNKMQKHKLILHPKYKVLAVLADGLCDPTESGCKRSLPQTEQVLRAYNKYESEVCLPLIWCLFVC
jgi:hypothetical protein